MRLKLIPLHSLAAMGGGTVLALLAYFPVWFIVSSVAASRATQVGVWYGPVVWGSALVLGFLLRRRLRQREAYLVWLVGLAWLVAGLHSVKSFDHTWSRVQMDLFPAKDSEASGTEGVYVLFYTCPAMCSLAYSIGAFVESCWAQRH